MSNSALFTTRLADWSQDLADLRFVREAVFVDEQKVPIELEWDDKDSSALHVIAYDVENNPVGTGRLMDNGQIGRMAVVKSWRKRGVGLAILRELLKAAESASIAPLFLNAQKSAIPFYQNEGFEPVGPEFMEANIPHQRMERSNE